MGGWSPISLRLYLGFARVAIDSKTRQSIRETVSPEFADTLDRLSTAAQFASLITPRKFDCSTREPPKESASNGMSVQSVQSIAGLAEGERV